MRTLLLRQLRDRRSSVIGWTLGWLILISMYVATWPTVKNHGKQYDEILRDLPAAMRSAVGGANGSAFSSPAGYFTAELLAVTGPILVLTMGVLLGSGALAKDEEDGSLEVILAQPVSRTSVLVARFGEGLVEMLGVLALAGLSLYALGSAVDLHLSLGSCLQATAMLALLGIEGMTLGLLVAALTGRTSRARALTGAVGLIVFLLNALGPSISWLADLVVLSPFHTLLKSDPFRHVVPAGTVVTLVLPSLAFVFIAAWAFRRRDLRFH